MAELRILLDLTTLHSLHNLTNNIYVTANNNNNNNNKQSLKMFLPNIVKKKKKNRYLVKLFWRKRLIFTW